MSQIKKVGILTSGGDAPGMNAAIRAIVRSCYHNGLEPYGIFDGYKGIIERNIKKIDRQDVSGIIGLGGTFLGSARFVEFQNVEVQKQAADILREFGIDALIAIGGDGTYMGAYKLHLQGIPCIGVPATIDNDVASTEYTIGFDTALNTVVDSIDKIKDTITSHKRGSVVEVMGKYCPDLSVRGGICCGAEVIVTSASDYSKESIIKAAHDAKARGKKQFIVVVAEHTVPVTEIEKVLNEDGTYETRSTVLGHVQRGGRPSAFDRVLASSLGDYAVQLLLEGKTGVCVGTKGAELTHMDIIEAANLPNKKPVTLMEQYKNLI